MTIFVGLFITLLVLASDLIPMVPVEDAALSLTMLMGSVLIAPAFAILQSFVTVHRWASLGHADVSPTSPARFRCLKLLVVSNLVVWILCCFAMMTVIQWPQLVRVNWGLNAIPLLDELMLIAPMACSISLAWFLLFDAERRLNQTIDEYAAGQFQRRMDLTTERVRIFAGLVLVPICILFFARDLLEIFAGHDPSPVITGLFFAVLLAILLCVYPLLVVSTWRTRRLDPTDPRESRLISCLQAAAREANESCANVLVWETRNQILNAMVIGMVPRFRRVLLTDAVIQHFDDQEIIAIFRHEIGHLHHRHIQQRMLLLLAPPLVIAILACKSQVAEALGWISVNVGIPTSILATLLLTIPVIAYLVFCVSRMVRDSEIQADAFAYCNKNGVPNEIMAEHYRSAMLKMAVQMPQHYERGSLAHPSIKRRLELIRLFVAQPSALASTQLRIQRQKKLFRGGLLVVVLILLLI